MSIMANYWATRKNWDITLLTFDDGSQPSFYDLDQRVRHLPLGIAADSPTPIVSLRNNLRRIYKLRRAIRNSRPEAVISFVDRTNVTVLLATRGMSVPVVIAERTDPAMNLTGTIWQRSQRWIYPQANLLVVQSKGALRYFSPTLQSRACIIPNPISMPPIDQTQVDIQIAKPLLVAMGRLGPEKGFDILLKAFARVKDGRPEWSLMVLGEGTSRTELESLRYELNLSDCVSFPGRVRNPHVLLRQADLFVMPSRFEGFPNALCEAMACSLPVISTDCPSGPREIVRHEVDGILVPNDDVSALAEAMDRLMASEAERNRLAQRAPEVVERFALEKVMSMWEEALCKVSGRAK